MALHARLSALAICAFGAATAAAHVLLPFSQLPRLAERATSDQTALTSAGYAYLVNVTVGTPGQPVSLLVSPSTGDSWVPDANTVSCSPEWYYHADGASRYLKDIPSSECGWGSFNATRSSTYLPANARYSYFSATYIDGTSASGKNFTDKLLVGDIELEDFPMGLASSASRWIGMLGLGFSSSSGSVSSSSSRSGMYPTFMGRMVSAAKIASPAYSIWLDNAEGTSGGLLFGAIDQSRYTGNLMRLPASGIYKYKYAFSTTVSSINGTGDDGSALPRIHSNDFPLDLTIGPGELLSYLPEVLADKIASMAGAKFNDTLRYYVIACDAGKTSKAKFVLELGGSGGPTLNVETADLVIPQSVSLDDYRGKRLNGTNKCLFGVQKYYSGGGTSSSSRSTYFNIGSSLLRRTYLVFDLVNQEVAVAPVKFTSGSNTPSPTVVAFASYGATAPSATGFCGSSGCVSSCGKNGCATSTAGPRSSSRPSSHSNVTSASLDNWQKIAIGVGVTFGTLTLIAAIAAVILLSRVCRGARKERTKEPGDDESGHVEAEPQPSESQNPTTEHGDRGAMVPPGTLPVIQEKQEGAVEPSTQVQAPQLPALGTQLSRPMMTPPEPATPSVERSQSPARAQDTEISDISEPDVEPAAPGPPEGNGKEVDRPVSES